MPTAVAIEEPPEATTAVTRGNLGSALIPQNWEQVFRVANVFAASSMVPKVYQGKPEDCIVAIAYGAEIGLPPMSALQSIAVIGGRPGLYGDGFLGVIQSAPAYARHAEFYELEDGARVYTLSAANLANEMTRAIAKFWRRGNADPFVAEFSIGDAKRARLWGKEGPWTAYPARMLKWRARGFAGRDAFAAELRGMSIAELLEDDGPLPPAEAPIVAPRRRSEKRSIEAPAPAEAPGMRLHSGEVPAEAIQGFVNGPPPPQPMADPWADVEPGTIRPPLPPDVELPPPPTAEDEGAAARRAMRDMTATMTAGFMPAPPPAKRGPGRPPKPRPEPLTASSVVITETAYVAMRDRDPFYEIKARIAKEHEAPIALNFVTRNKPLYDLAASAEGTDQTFAVVWKMGTTQDGTPCKILESIEPAEA